MKKINYIETEDKLLGSGHGYEFHYMPLSYDDFEKRPHEEPVAILLLDGWYNYESRPIQVRIHPFSSPILKGMDEKPELIIDEVKEAIELCIKKHGQLRLQKDKISDHVWTWING